MFSDAVGSGHTLKENNLKGYYILTGMAKV